MPFKDLPEGQTQYLDENGDTVGSINPLLDQSIDVLEIPQRTKNILNYYGFTAVADLYKSNSWKTNLWAESKNNYLGLFLCDKEEIEKELTRISENYLKSVGEGNDNG